MEKIVAYTAPGCPKCAALKMKLKEKGVEFETCEDVDYMINVKKFEHVPMLEVGEKIYNYKEALKWAETR